MSVSADDIKFRKSVVVTDTVANGGRVGYVQILSGVKHNLFPRVTKSERTAGVTRYRKQFICNENSADEIAYSALVYLEFPTNAGDRILAALGTKEDTQNDLDSTYKWASCGPLNAGVSAGGVTVAIAMENTDVDILNGGLIHIANKYESGTVDTTARIGDSVEYSVPLSKWMPIAHTDDVIYPNGLYLGGSKVMTIQPTDTEEWLRIADPVYTAEDIGTGDGVDTAPPLTTLANVPICLDSDKLPVVTTLDGADVAMTVNVAADGTCSGDCSAGTLNMETGVWTVDITWTSAPKNAQDILVTYHERAHTWSGSVVTIALDDMLANNYLAAETYVGICLELGDIEPVFLDWVEISSAGTYDESTYPLVLSNLGTVTDSFTITFTDATHFGCAGVAEGSLGSGIVTSDFAPINPNTGLPYFTLDKDGWSGSWVLGDTVTFKTVASAVGVWLKEIVPALTAAEPFNLLVLGLYCE
ncbi:MAG: hypothetical protein EHM49_00150 [Deltaproteobacteria bacterium]|nr:MAG: hypothetical protein EHM49_00150 [Deltaproteobacteria bacterium]